jgi:hypothetical protein
MTRSYPLMDDFPVWFFNLPAANGDLPRPEDIPPGAVTHMTITGTLTASTPGVFSIETNDAVTATARVGDIRSSGGRCAGSCGPQPVSIDVTLVKSRWKLLVLWNGDDLFSQVSATRSPPSTLDRVFRPWGKWVTAVLAGALLLLWGWTALAGLLDGWTLAWTLSASIALGLAAAFTPERRWQWAVLALVCAVLLPMSRRISSARGAFLLIGVPWLALVVVATWYGIGRITFYGAGNDHWLFQRWAYRIFLQGYWLEGGEKTFWFQPLYRWMAGGLHVIFGDSSAGEAFWDGGWVLVMAMFSYVVTRAVRRTRWGLAAASLALFMAGPGFIFVRGLSEITSYGFIYLGAMFA